MADKVKQCIQHIPPEDDAEVHGTITSKDIKGAIDIGVPASFLNIISKSIILTEIRFHMP
jgi:hypothetical protein